MSTPLLREVQGDTYFEGPLKQGMKLAALDRFIAVEHRADGYYHVGLYDDPACQHEAEFGSATALTVAWRFAIGALAGPIDEEYDEQELRDALARADRKVRDARCSNVKHHREHIHVRPTQGRASSQLAWYCTGGAWGHPVSTVKPTNEETPMTTLDTTTEDLITVARGLATEPDDSNPEYDRALVELTMRYRGIPEDERDMITRRITGRCRVVFREVHNTPLHYVYDERGALLAGFVDNAEAREYAAKQDRP